MRVLTNQHLGARFGKKLRAQYITYYNAAHSAYECTFCNYLKPTVKRESVGIWKCTFCKVVFAGPAYTPYIGFKK